MNKKSKVFNHKEVEKRWQNKWAQKNTYGVSNIDKPKNKYYNLMMFPYPSAEDLHAGNMFAFTGSDVYGRFKRMQGYEVLEPIGLDGFGIHSENYALKVRKSPQEHLKTAEKRFYQQLHIIGNSFDWDRKVETYDPDYYKWTQWLFIQMFKAGLAYRKKSPLNFCPSCKTVLSDEQVMTPAQAGKIPEGYKSVKDVPEGVRVCERCGTIVEIQEFEQWFFRITDYADKLLDGLTRINWPEKVKIAQRNWIGKKEGITISYKIKASNLEVECWTSRPDTNFGATFIVLSPEHPLALALTQQEKRKEILKYINRFQSRSKEDRASEGEEKTGVFTGSYAINELNGAEMPIWISDFVLMEVGTGAVVGVPGHDLRDFQFAKKFKIPIKRVVVGTDGDKSEITKESQVQEEEGKMVNSEFLNGLDIHKATEKIMDHFEKNGWGVRKTYYHLRDWTISRQRYWGPPIPMIYCEKCTQKGKSWFTSGGAEEWLKSKIKRKASKKLIENKRSLSLRDWKLRIKNSATEWSSVGWYPEENLPVELPKISDYLPKGEGKGPLANHPEFYRVSCPECGSDARRETDVSDIFLDSSWYFLAYPMQGTKVWDEGPSAGSGRDLLSNRIIESWLPVDLYFGGAEHAVLHLMYSRFVTMVLNDLKYIDFSEPFPRFYAHGLMIKDGAKMSKSKGNVVNPDEYIEKYGADTLRLYLMFMGPMDGYPDFRDTGIEGMRKFIERVWDLFNNQKNVVLEKEEDARDVLIKMHQTINKASKDIEGFRYNTAISAIMEFVNILRTKAQNSNVKTQSKIHCADLPALPAAKRWQVGWDQALETLALLLAPFAPHLSEEVWVNVLGKPFSIHKSKWPGYDNKLVKSKTVSLVVQVNGKLRAIVTMDSSLAVNQEKVESEAKKLEKISKWLDSGEIKNVIFVPEKLINFVLK